MSKPASVTVASTATLLATAGYTNGKILIQNVGVVAVYLGTDNTVTTSTGIQLAPGASLEETYSLYQKETWYGIVSSGTGTVIVKVL